MLDLSRERVHTASAAWLWIPPTAGRIDTEEYLALRFPAWYEHPLQLVGIRPRRPLAEVLDEVIDRCRAAVGTAAPQLLAWVRLDAPEGLAEALVERGGVLDETLDVLARPLGELPGLDLRVDVEVRWAADFDTFVDAVHLNSDVFGGSKPDRAGLEPVWPEELTKLRTGGGGAVVAYLDGRPVGTAGLTVAGPDARLWGGGVLPDARGRGVYRALLAARLAYAVERRCELAIVKGRVETSAPILRRAGFSAYGQERSYLLDLSTRPA
ncbi:GNAT family N-acetyltransferase [Nocardioides panacisoli]|uniref:N-acetyltransferase domain-containing protein n=1 Tax=Nocardioides panacisoli TaxID=627624 RepID=A0ABP7HZP4_9ACTN